MKDRIVGRQNLHRSLLHRNPRPAQLRRIRRELSFVEVSNTRVVLHHQRPARENKIEQLLVIGHDIFLRVVGADPQHNRSVLTTRRKISWPITRSCSILFSRAGRWWCSTTRVLETSTKESSRLILRS